MSDTPNPSTPPPTDTPAGAPAAAPTGSGAQVKFAGKYDSPEAFERGIREGAKAAGLPFSEKAKLIGDGGMFASVKEAEEGYKALERAITAKGKADAAPKPVAPMPGDKPDEPEVVDDDADLETLVTKAGLNTMELGREFITNQKLTDEQYTKLRKAMPGATKKVIDAIIGTQIQVAKAEWDNATTAAEQVAGGREQLTSLVQWASKNMDAAVVQGLSAQAKANPKFYPAMIEVFASAYAKKAGGTPGGAGVRAGAGAPSSTAVVTTAAEFRALRLAVERNEPGARERMAAADLSKFLGSV